ncbi:MAG: 4Fe-4S dicluster domain-containing protein [Terriglobales bacterium]
MPSALFTAAPPPPPREATGFFTDTTLCIGCKACEVACKQWNQLPADGYDWRATSYDNTHALSASTWRHVAFAERPCDGRDARPAALSAAPAEAPHDDPGAPIRWLMLSDVCKHCQQAPCEEACPTGALIYNEFGNVYVQQDICNGCGYCVSACPFGVLDRAESDGRVHKCTLCYDRQKDGLEPACAKACPTDSIVFGPLAELQARAQQRLQAVRARGEEGAYLYGAEPAGEYSALGAFFLLTDPPESYNLPAAPRRPKAHLGRNYAWAALTAAALAAVTGWVFAAGLGRGAASGEPGRGGGTEVA